MTHQEYGSAREKIRIKLGIPKEEQASREDSVRIAAEMPTHILQAIVDNEIELPSMAFWVPEWLEVCENELFERVLLKSDKCL